MFESFINRDAVDMCQTIWQT